MKFEEVTQGMLEFVGALTILYIVLGFLFDFEEASLRQLVGLVVIGIALYIVNIGIKKAYTHYKEKKQAGE